MPATAYIFKSMMAPGRRQLTISGEGELGLRRPYRRTADRYELM